MKNTGTCPKCGGRNIALIRGKDSRIADRGLVIGATVFSTIPTDIYVCGSCGYTERWVRQEDLAKLAKAAERAERWDSWASPVQETN